MLEALNVLQTNPFKTASPFLNCTRDAPSLLLSPYFYSGKIAKADLLLKCCNLAKTEQFLLYLLSLPAVLPVQITWLLKRLQVGYGNPRFSPTPNITIQNQFGVSAQCCSAGGWSLRFPAGQGSAAGGGCAEVGSPRRWHQRLPLIPSFKPCHEKDCGLPWSRIAEPSHKVFPILKLQVKPLPAPPVLGIWRAVDPCPHHSNLLCCKAVIICPPLPSLGQTKQTLLLPSLLVGHVFQTSYHCFSARL